MDGESINEPLSLDYAPQSPTYSPFECPDDTTSQIPRDDVGGGNGDGAEEEAEDDDDENPSIDAGISELLAMSSTMRDYSTVADHVCPADSNNDDRYVRRTLCTTKQQHQTRNAAIEKQIKKSNITVKGVSCIYGEEFRTLERLDVSPNYKPDTLERYEYVPISSFGRTSLPSTIKCDTTISDTRPEAYDDSGDNQQDDENAKEVDDETCSADISEITAKNINSSNVSSSVRPTSTDRMYLSYDLDLTALPRICRVCYSIKVPCACEEIDDIVIL